MPSSSKSSLPFRPPPLRKLSSLSLMQGFVTGTELEGFRPARAPGFQIVSVLRPGKFFFELVGDVIQLKIGVLVVPPQYAQGGFCIHQFSGRLAKMRKGELALVVFTVGRNEQ